MQQYCTVPCPNHTIQPKSYLAEHIPGAVLFNIDAAYYPSKYIRFDLYPPQDFEKFIRLLGVNNSDHVLYGHDKVSVLNGGLDAWKKAGQPVASGDVIAKPGNFIAKPIDPSLIITFEELDRKNADGKSLFEELDKGPVL
ncbi:hypothetical protein TELCIR_13667 [Teladorsagia circumcincta]|uniref:Rhodanese domain-containing protein n=1 Tax=Teladorsagia circumcincta TaxID=45464 RepID=A0A2G9U3D1_TELCI|nr:hypothetical protein TELCIR_13667 [Teladorsagia circumcincta]